jgi:hypothetical protein
MTPKFDPRIPAAYGGDPKALIARLHAALRDAVTGKPENVRYGALLLGPTGDGKSSAAAWAVRRWDAWRSREARRNHLEQGWIPANYVEGIRIAWLDAIEATDAERRYRLGSGDPEELAAAYRAEWLVLDDVGLSTSATLVQLVLARRYQACLPTVVTSGLTAAQLSVHIGAATVRRIIEHEGEPGVFVDCHDSAEAARA